MKIVIRAGGVGSRLWPVSRQNEPKQFHALVGDRTMLEDAIDRVLPLVALEDIFISTNTSSEDIVRARHHEIPDANIIVEPARKDTAAAIGLESIVIHKQDPDAVVASLGSDHSVRKPNELRAVLTAAEALVQEHPEYIVPIGIHPTQPDSGYGYIQLGDVIDTHDRHQLWAVERFTEKPDTATAKQFLSEGNYLWNANMFVWKVSTILSLYEQHLPEMYAELMKIEAALGTPDEKAVINAVYPTLEKIAVDYAIIEKTDSIAALSADIGWNDIGDWARLKDEIADNEADNVVLGAEHVSHDSKNVLVYSNVKDKLVAIIGVDNLVVVETDDVLLVCDKYSSPDVKKIVEELQSQKRNDVL
jgi:mannose-1-phosphate guanylyltransferase